MCAVKKTAEIPQVQFFDKVDESLVLTQRQNHNGPDCSDAHGDATVAVYQQGSSTSLLRHSRLCMFRRNESWRKQLRFHSCKWLGKSSGTDLSDSLGESGQDRNVSFLQNPHPPAMFVSNQFPQVVEELVEGLSLSKGFNRSS